MFFSYLCIPSFIKLCLLFLSLCLSFFSLPVCHHTRTQFFISQRNLISIFQEYKYFNAFAKRKIACILAYTKLSFYCDGLTKLKFFPLLIEFSVPLCFTLLGFTNFVIGSLRTNIVLKHSDPSTVVCLMHVSRSSPWRQHQ